MPTVQGCPGQSRDLTDFEGVSRDPGITLPCPGISCFSTEIAIATVAIPRYKVASVSTNCAGHTVFHYANLFVFHLFVFRYANLFVFHYANLFVFHYCVSLC